MKDQIISDPHFAGSIPQNYEQYLGPMFFEPYAADVADRIDTSNVVNALEIGSGTGRVTRHLRKVLPFSSKLTASDISPDMLSVAQEKLKDQDIDWKIIDAEKLPFGDNSLDLIVCYFGFMFVTDRAKAYEEVLRTLRKGGMFLMATWDKLEANEASYIFRKTVKEYLGDNLPETYKLPFSMHDPVDIEKALKKAGFSKIRSGKVKLYAYSASSAEAAQGLAKGGSLYNELMKRNPIWIHEIMSIVEKELSEKYGKAPMKAPMSAVITQAWK